MFCISSNKNMLKNNAVWLSMSDFSPDTFVLSANASVMWAVIYVDRCHRKSAGRPATFKKKEKKTDSIDAKILLTFTDKAIIAFNMSYSRRECELLQKFQPYHRPPVMGRHYSASLHFSVMYTQSGLLIKRCLISTEVDEGLWSVIEIQAERVKCGNSSRTKRGSGEVVGNVEKKCAVGLLNVM